MTQGFRLNQCFARTGKTFLFLSAIFSVSGCGLIDRDNNLRVWENAHHDTATKMRRHHYKAAKQAAFEAVGTAETFGNGDFRLGVSYSDLADVYNADGQFKKAEMFYKKAIEVLDKSAKSGAEFDRELASEDEANAVARLADLYASKGKYELARETFQQAVTSFEGIVNRKRGKKENLIEQQLVSSLCGLAQVLQELKQPDQAANSYDRAMRIALSCNSPEFVLQEIRQSYIKLLGSINRPEIARRLLADSLWAEYTNKGLSAFYSNDFHAAEIFLTKALEEAKISEFGPRRMMRSIANLSAVYLKQERNQEAMNVCEQGLRYARENPVLLDRDFDKVLSNLVGFYQTNREAAKALPLLHRQLAFRNERYGNGSLTSAETLAEFGKTYVILGNAELAKKSADAALAILNPAHIHDKRAALALNEIAGTYDLMGNYDQAESVYRLLLDLQQGRMDSGDVRLTGYSVQNINFYHKYHKKKEAEKLVADLIQHLSKANANQRASAFPYIELATSLMMTDGWYDSAIPLAELGQSLLRNELSGSTLDPQSKERWTKDIALMESNLHRKF